MAELPSNAFDAEAACSTGRVQIGSAEAPTQFILFIKAARNGKKSQCPLRLEKQNAAGRVTSLRGEIQPGLGMRRLVNLAANEDLYVKCMGDTPRKKGRFTVTFFG